VGNENTGSGFVVGIISDGVVVAGAIVGFKVARVVGELKKRAVRLTAAALTVVKGVSVNRDNIWVVVGVIAGTIGAGKIGVGGSIAGSMFDCGTKDRDLNGRNGL